MPEEKAYWFPARASSDYLGTPVAVSRSFVLSESNEAQIQLHHSPKPRQLKKLPQPITSANPSQLSSKVSLVPLPCAMRARAPPPPFKPSLYIGDPPRKELETWRMRIRHVVE